MLTVTFVVTVVDGELRAPEPGEPGDPGEPGFKEADDGGLDRLVLVEPEKESLKLGFCRPDKLDFPSTSFSSVSFTEMERWRNHCLTILKVILIGVEPHLLLIFQCPCITTEAPNHIGKRRCYCGVHKHQQK
ncbi:hypothetical protein EYF80_027417 [Liparis tanakae]|uniref:Uncharacterized protein n=1 Tax=Liparis tanakae TaxID=230148 RepID=A0A4Z2H9G9_9TELE|nr:hypothetical protein EYF80_027417 [Liparis tanakae]